jgi:outer membrane receptor protein involved in Fe transport
MRKKLWKPTILSGLVAAIGWPAAQAQTTPAPSQSSQLDLVIVTSQKRKENLKEVPLSVSVVSGDAIQENHISDVGDLTRAVPNLSYSSQGGAGLSTLELRGVSSQAGAATVSIYLDDISLTTRNIYSQGAAEPRFFDIDRVEVLRGPQGTLYGASSLGGTIKFISRQPDATKFSGDAYGELSSTSHAGTNHMLQGVVNVPLIQGSTALRIGVQEGHDSGYIDRVDPASLKVIEKGINSTHWEVLKLALKTDLGKGWSVTPAVFTQRYKADDIDAAYLDVGAFQLPAGAPATPLALFQTSKPLREPSKDRLTVPSITLNGDVGIGDVTGILSGYTRRFDRIQDGTYVNVPYIASQVTDPALASVVGGLPSAVLLNNKVDQTSLELRIASKDYDAARSPFTWIAGVYVARTKTQVYDNEPVYGINAAFARAGRDINSDSDLAGSFPGAFTGDSSYYSARHYNDRQTAFFGELTYHLAPTLRAIAGVRFVNASQHFTREGDFYYAGGPSNAVIDASWKPVTPRFAVDWDMSKETTLYTNIAKGFRLGGANRPIPDPSVNPLVGQDLADLHLPGKPPASFGPDSLWSYEVGSKSRLFDNRLALNLAAYYIDWKNIQQDVSLPLSAFDFETNVGRAKVWGFEAEARWRVGDAWTLNAAYSYTHAVFAEDTVALGTDSNGVLNARKGDPIQGVPKFSARLGFEYRFYPVEGYEAFLRGNGAWTGASYGTFVRDNPDYRRPGYFTADASAGFTRGRWEFSLFVKNAFNNHKVIQQPPIQSVSEALYLRPRTIGMTGRLDF